MLFLRGLWLNDKLHFDSAGTLIAPSELTNPLRSGLLVNSIMLEKSHLLIAAKRVIVYRQDGKLKGEPVGGPVELQFDLPLGGDYSSDLDEALTDHLEDLTAVTPLRWLPCLNETLKPDLAQPYTSAKEVTPPKITFEPEPQFPEQARGKRFEAKILLSLTVDSCGNPTRIKLVKPSAGVLNQSAIDAVRQYRFTPALLKGVPVPFTLQVEVAFTGS